MRVQNQRGFTLVELSVAMLIAVAIMWMSLSAFNRLLPLWRLREASNDVVCALQAARAKAVLDRTTVIVDFDVNRGIYALYSEVSGGSTIYTTDYTGTVRWFGKLPKTIRFTRPDTGRAITAAPVGLTSEDAFVFDSSGILQSGTRPADIYVGYSPQGLYRRVRVTLAGTVKLEKWDGTAWR